jgi:hypothetical protein
MFLRKFLLLFAAFVLHSCVLQPTEPATNALKSDSLVVVETTADYISFQPRTGSPQTGFVFYPGGLVNEQAYSPLCRLIAAAGYYVAIVPMPLNLAVFASDKGRSVLTNNRSISRWAIGGHSLGGAMAARFVHSDSTLFRGLVLYAAFPDVSNDVSKRTNLAVLSISASLDGLATPDEINKNKVLLPPNTQYLVLEGGNHAQFGSYGRQNGDKEATMSAEEQLRRTAEATIAFLKTLR